MRFVFRPLINGPKVYPIKDNPVKGEWIGKSPCYDRFGA